MSQKVEKDANDHQQTALLSPELLAQLGVDDAREAVSVRKIKKGGKGNKRSRVDSETRELANTLSKTKQKKLKQLADRKAKEARRSDLYRKLQEKSLSSRQLSLLQSSKTISQSQVTLHNRLKHAVQRAAAGMTLEDATVDDLQSHPNVVADIEDALRLPIGGVLAMVKRFGCQPPSPSSKADSIPGVGVSKGKGKRKVRPKKETTKEAELAKDEVGTNRQVGVKPSDSITKKFREVRAPRQQAPSSSSSSSSSSSDDEDEVERDNDDAILCTGETSASNTAPSLESTLPVTEPATAIASNAIKATGSDWATKVMSSLSNLKSKRAVTEMQDKNNRDSTATRSLETESKKRARACEGEVVGTCADKDASGNSSITAESLNNEEAGAASYPAPPRWLTEDIPAYQPTETPLLTAARMAKAEAGDGGNGGVDSEVPTTGTSVKRVGSYHPEKWVRVSRSAEAQALRMALPVCGMEQEIVEGVYENDVIVLCGETGSGKSTQVPQFLYEAGYAQNELMIGVTQPRRVAAVSTARRVAEELGTACGRGGSVAYQIRHDSEGVGAGTRIKFMTDGVLLREVTSDLLLRGYSAVLLDEAHERNLNTDILLGLLSRSLPLRRKVAEEELRRWDMLSEERRKNAKVT
ncbi:unnamed protein product [Choristocarpus tenellus]